MQWWPGLVTILDDAGERRGTFINAGWVDRVHWLSSTRLMISGFSEAFNGGMVALLDVGALDGRSPEVPGGVSACSRQQPGQFALVLPRSELNIVTASRFNRAVLHVMGDRITGTDDRSSPMRQARLTRSTSSRRRSISSPPGTAIALGLAPRARNARHPSPDPRAIAGQERPARDSGVGAGDGLADALPMAEESFVPNRLRNALVVSGLLFARHPVGERETKVGSSG